MVKLQGVLQTRESPGAHEPRGRNESEGASGAGAGSRGQGAGAPPARPAGRRAPRAAARGAEHIEKCKNLVSVLQNY